MCKASKKSSSPEDAISKGEHGAEEGAGRGVVSKRALPSTTLQGYTMAEDKHVRTRKPAMVNYTPTNTKRTKNFDAPPLLVSWSCLWPTQSQTTTVASTSTTTTTTSSSKRKRADTFKEEFEDAVFTSEHERLTHVGLNNVSRWEDTDNPVARWVVLMALYSPNTLKCIDKLESKLYSTLVNTVWVDEREKSVCALSERGAGALATFVSSIVGTVKCKTRLDTTMLSSTNDDSDVHDLLERHGFIKLFQPKGREDKERFWNDLRKKYGTRFILGRKKSTPSHVLDDVWLEAVRAWAGPKPKDDYLF